MSKKVKYQVRGSSIAEGETARWYKTLEGARKRIEEIVGTPLHFELSDDIDGLWIMTSRGWTEFFPYRC